MTTYRAVVKYTLDATDAEKRRALRDGLVECACELVNLGATEDQIDDLLENAKIAADEERIHAAP